MLNDGEREMAGIDGDALRRATQGRDASPLHLVSDWASRQRLVLGQDAADKKRDEIVSIARRLESLELAGALVIIEAMGCQREIAEKILEKNADYLLAFTDSWRTLAEDARLYFEREKDGACDYCETNDGDHGRNEVRRHYATHDVDWLFAGRRLPGEPRFPALAMIGMVEATVECDGRTSVSRRFYLSSASLSAKQFARADRAHWGVESGLHWVFDDDLTRSRTKIGLADMATLKQAALRLLDVAPDGAGREIKGATFAWSEERPLGAPPRSSR